MAVERLERPLGTIDDLGFLAQIEGAEDGFVAVAADHREHRVPCFDEFEAALDQRRVGFAESHQAPVMVEHGGLDIVLGIDGEVDPGPLADDPGPADYPADDPGPAEPAAAVPTEVVMASRKQLGQLKQIRDAEKYDADLEWFGFLSDLLGEQITKASDITSEQADRILATFQTQEN